MASICVISIDVDRRKAFVDLILAGSSDGATQIVNHLRPNATSVVSLDSVRLRELAAAAEQLTERTFAAWVESLHQPIVRKPAPLTIRRWIGGAENFPDMETGASVDDLIRAAAGDLTNSAVVDTISRTIFVASDGNCYTLNAEAVLERIDGEYLRGNLASQSYRAAPPVAS